MTDKPTQSMFMDDSPVETGTNPANHPNTDTLSEYSQPMATEEAPISNNGKVVDLPSKGLLGYPSSVQFREMMVKDEENLAQMTEKTYFRTINGLIKDLLGSPDWFEKMCVHDRDYMLIYIWATTYSATKDVTMKCPHCEAENNSTVDFTKLDFTDLDGRFKGYYDMQLGTGGSIRLRLNTTLDEQEVEQFLASGDNAKHYRYEHLMLVKSIDIGTPMLLKQKVEWVDNTISAKEMKTIKAFHASLNYGVPNVINHVCGSCDNRFRNPLPFGIEDIVIPGGDVSPDIEQFV